EVDQGVEVLRRFQPHAAAVAAVAAVRPAERDELLAPESDAAVAAVSGGDGDFGFVDEFHGCRAGTGGAWVVKRKCGAGTKSSRSPEQAWIGKPVPWPGPGRIVPRSRPITPAAPDRNKKPRRSGASRRRGVACL